MKGYKAFNKDWTCRNKQYRLGETFSEDVDLSVCERGMHFCERLPQVFNFYPFDPDQTIVAEVEALGDVVTEDNSKFCTNKLQIIREIPWDEVQKSCACKQIQQSKKNTEAISLLLLLFHCHLSFNLSSSLCSHDQNSP